MTPALRTAPLSHAVLSRGLGYDDRLVCVRYRNDPERKKRFTTVELVVAEPDWEPPRSGVAPDQVVGLCVAFSELAVRERVKQAGWTWNPERRLWQVRYERVVALDLTDRIVAEPASAGGCPPSSDRNPQTDARGHPAEDARIHG